MKHRSPTRTLTRHLAALALALGGAAALAQPSSGEVRKIDSAQGKITLKHGEIKNLDMPPMSMVFQVSDPAMVDKVKAGDKVRFSAEKVGGAYTITAIEVVK